MTDVIRWPKVLKPQSISIDLAHRNLRGSAAASGFTQVVSNSAGLWRVTYNDVPLYSTAQIRCWRAIDALSEGQLNPISIPLYDFPRSPSSDSDSGTNLYHWYNYQVPHSDESLYDDGTGHDSSYTNIQTSATVAVGATTIPVIKTAPLVTLEPGMHFSISDRLYRIKKITAQSSGAATLVVTPPVREFIYLSERLEFDCPRIRVRLTSDSAMKLPLDFNRQSFHSLDFVEDV